MKKISIIVLSIVSTVTVVLMSGFTEDNTSTQKTNLLSAEVDDEVQFINMFVSHGHCSTPFRGKVQDLEIITSQRDDQGNPLEGMKISFEINPNSFNVCSGEELTAKIKTPDLFISENDEMISFRTTEVYTMGIDWYQINGKMSIKGVEHDVKFFATGIRDPKDASPSFLVLEGQLNLLDWGIDYDKIVNGNSADVATKWMHFNMKIEMPTSV